MSDNWKKDPSYRIKCDQCYAVSIQGVAVHEQGCPYEDRPWTFDEIEMVCRPMDTAEYDEYKAEQYDYDEEIVL